MDGRISIPLDLDVPPDASEEFANRVTEINMFLHFARERLDKLEREVDRLGNVRGTMYIHNAPGGMVIGDY